MLLNNKYLKKIKGDASLRDFFRKKTFNKSSILVYCKKDKFKNLLIYDSINKILIKNNIQAPSLYSQNFKKNFIEIEDFGDQTLFEILNKKKNQKIKYYKLVIKLLNKIQLIKDKKVKNFNNNFYIIPEYRKKILFKEAKLFCDWYVPKILSKKKIKLFNRLLEKQIKFLLSKIKLKNNTFVHRDFHVSNIMKKNKKLALIDSQDALIGNKAYDLASLVDDVRLKTSKTLKEKIYTFYIKTNYKKLNKYKLRNDFEILSVLRNLKIIGIFSRLSERDNKKKYLKFIPYAWKLIGLRIDKNPVFYNLKKILRQNFPNKLR
tara:strand:+ start:5644 stop:6600 length:957 start_codon:yes stop_codon:yes gene_type:complete